MVWRPPALPHQPRDGATCHGTTHYGLLVTKRSTLVLTKLNTYKLSTKRMRHQAQDGTTHSAGVGTPSYAAPEQLRPGAAVSAEP